MAIRFRKVERNLIPNDESSEKRVFPIVTYKYDKAVDLKEFSKEIAGQSILGEGEVYNALKYFRTLLQKTLLSGKLVNIDGLGCFYLSLQGKGAKTAEEFTTGDISGLRICFRASNDIRIHNGATTRTDGLSFLDVDKVNGEESDNGSGGGSGSGSGEGQEENPLG